MCVSFLAVGETGKAWHWESRFYQMFKGYTFMDSGTFKRHRDYYRPKTFFSVACPCKQNYLYMYS